MSERIIAAAIKGPDGTLYIADRHCQAGWEYNRTTGKRPYPGGDAQGFVTGSMRFVSREEAMLIALEAGQVRRDPATKDHRTPGLVMMDATELYSEDLKELRPQRRTV